MKDDNTQVTKVLGKNTRDCTPLFDGREHANIYIHHMLRCVTMGCITYEASGI